MKKIPASIFIATRLYIIDSGTNVTKLREVVAQDGRTGQKLVAKEPIGSPAEEGYLRPRLGCAISWSSKRAATRLVDMLVGKNERRAI